MKKNYFIVILLLLSFQAIQAQQLHYRFEKQTETYVPLTNPVILPLELWEELSEQQPEEGPSPIISIPFDFKLFDTNIEDLSFELGAIFSFFEIDNREYQSGFVTTPELIDIASVDPTLPIQTVVSTQLEGNAGNRIFKIQISNAASYKEFIDTEGNSTSMTVSFQLWLHEGTNEISYHYGPNSITDFEVFAYDGIMGCGILEFSYEMDEEEEPINATVKSSLLSGNSIAPLLKTNSQGFLVNYPANGTVYKFTPATLSMEKTATTTFTMYPNPTDNILNISGELNIAHPYSIFDISGKKLDQGTISEINRTIDVSKLAAGVYLLKLGNSNKATKFIKK